MIDDITEKAAQLSIPQKQSVDEGASATGNDQSIQDHQEVLPLVLS